MKQVLIIDESPYFREYLKLKLEENNIETAIGINVMDGVTKMKNLMPDLIIMDSGLSRQGYREALKQKKTSPNTAGIPVIIIAHDLDQKEILAMIPYNVKKVFKKPVKIDSLFNALSRILGVPFIVDESPGIVEVHVNDDIVFIEIAQGLNRDKVDVLGFKIQELIELYDIRAPEIIIMMSDITLGYGDGPNLEQLLDTVAKTSRTKPSHIRVLTRDSFTRDFIEAQKKYAGVEVVSNLQYAVDGLLSASGQLSGRPEENAEIIGDKILSAQSTEEAEKLGLKFDADSNRIALDLLEGSLHNLRIAVIDDDFVIQELIRNTFSESGARVEAFSSGREFLAVVDTKDFDLAFLDLIMPNGDGLEVLRNLQTRDIKYPVIVLSAVTQRETVIKAYQLGIKSFLVKPLKPKDIYQKSMEILKATF